MNDFQFTHWPTEFLHYPKWPDRIPINQAFKANPDYYRRFNLPGHEGLDLYAPIGSKIFAVAPGLVVVAGWHKAYGYHVRLDHVDAQGQKNGFQSLYAHLATESFPVHGTVVSGGQILGLSGNTGNSTGPHLHLTLKYVDAYAGGPWYQGFPGRIIDPTPYISFIHQLLTTPEETNE